MLTFDGDHITILLSVDKLRTARKFVCALTLKARAHVLTMNGNGITGWSGKGGSVYMDLSWSWRGKLGQELPCKIFSLILIQFHSVSPNRL